MMVKPRCFRCMEPLNAPDEQCPSCKYDNQNRTNEPGMLSDANLKRQYQVGCALGRGGYGVTYLGYDRYMERKVIIREFFPERMAERAADGCTLSPVPGCEEAYRKACKRALLEARMASGMGEVKGIAQVYDAVPLNDTIYIVSERVDGEPLTDYIKRQKQRPSLAEALDMMEDVVEGLQKLHARDLVHRAVKPANVFISKATGKAMLTDFGATRLDDDPSINPLTEDSSVQRNTFSDFAPDVRIDQKGLAETLFFMLTGNCPPDEAERRDKKAKVPSIRAANQRVSVAGEDAIYQAMALDADERFNSIEAFWTALKSTAGRTPLLPIRQQNNDESTSKSQIIGCGVALFLFLVVFPLMVMLTSQTDEPTTHTDKTEVVSTTAQSSTVTVATEISEPVFLTEEEYQEMFDVGCLDCRLVTVGDYRLWVHDDRFAVISSYSGSGTEFVIPEYMDRYQIVGIKRSAIGYNESITSISIPACVNIEAGNPFDGCTQLSSITVAEDHPTLAVVDGVLFHKTQKRLVCYPQNLKAVKYVIPQGVEVIDDNAFSCCPILEEIIIPEGVTTIGNNAFYACSGLNGLSLPDSITTIGNKAFASNSFSGDFHIPDGVTSIGDQAFGYSDISSINIPNSVKTMGENPFYYCKRLKSIELSPDHPVFELIDGALFHKAEKKLIYCPINTGETEYIIPQGTEIIGGIAFFSCPFTSIIIPDSVITIGESAFYMCEELTSMIIPDGVKTIEARAFSKCISLASITVPDSVTDIGHFAFNTDNKKTTLLVSEDSDAHLYARKNNIPYTLVQGGEHPDGTPAEPAAPSTKDSLLQELYNNLH